MVPGPPLSDPAMMPRPGEGILEYLARIGLLTPELAAAASGPPAGSRQPPTAPRTILAAQHGWRGVVRKPTLFMAGEREAERVDIGKLGGADGGGRGGTVHNWNVRITGPIYGIADLDNKIVAVVQKAQRQGRVS